MDNNELLEKFKMNVAVNQFKKEYANEHTQKEEIKGRIDTMKRKLIAGLCGGVILLSGATLAASYHKIVDTFFLGKGLDTAAQNGYIANPDMDYIGSNTTATDEITGTILDDIKVNAKIEDFLMDDLNISVHFTFEIDTKVNQTFDLDTLDDIELKDLIVTDEENKILYCMDEKMLEKYCKENNLNETYLEFSDKYYNCGLNTVMQRHDKEHGIINFTYNMYTGGNASFPKSKKLNFKFTQIQLKREDWLQNENSIVNLKGNWNINLEVPEKMYNRKSVAYKVVNCENSDFQITNATLTDTGFEFGMIIANIEEPEQPQILKDLWKEYREGKINIDEYNRKINTEKQLIDASYEYFKSRTPVTITDLESEIGHEKIEKVTYVENEKGQKFKSTMSPSRRADGNFIDGNKFSFYETFELTTDTATDKLKVRVLFQDKPYVVELEKAYN